TLKSTFLVTLLHGCSGNVGDGGMSAPFDALISPPPAESALPGAPGLIDSAPMANSSVPSPSNATQTNPGVPVIPPSGSEPVAFMPSTGAYRRLTNAAFANSLRDLLEGPVEIGPLESDSWAVGGLSTVGAAVVSISELGVEQYQAAVESAVESAFSDPTRRDAILGCSPSGLSDTACFEAFVTAFGRRAFRGPLTSTQVARYVALVNDVSATRGDA